MYPACCRSGYEVSNAAYPYRAYTPTHSSLVGPVAGEEPVPARHGIREQQDAAVHVRSSPAAQRRKQQKEQQQLQLLR